MHGTRFGAQLKRQKLDLGCVDLQIGVSDDSTRRKPPSAGPSLVDTQNLSAEDEEMDDVSLQFATHDQPLPQMTDHQSS